MMSGRQGCLRSQATFVADIMSNSSHTIMKMRCELQAGMPALPGHFRSRRKKFDMRSVSGFWEFHYEFRTITSVDLYCSLQLILDQSSDQR